MSPQGPTEAQRLSKTLPRAELQQSAALPDAAEFQRSSKSVERLVVIGNFDGVHLGHRAVLESAAERARANALALCVLTFDPHPSAVLSEKSRPALTTTSRKLEILRDLFPNLEVFVQHFDLEIAALSPREFVERILIDHLHARTVLVGENFRFGKNRAGDLSTLRELGRELGFEAFSESLRGDDKGSYSSTRVRELIKAGDVSGAARLLGRCHRVTGAVTPGDGRARTLGFPTANLDGVPQACPGEGVYAVEAFVVEESNEQRLEPVAVLLGPAVAHLGPRPSLDRPPSFEVHLIDQQIDLYGKTLAVAFVERIRSVEKFANLEALRQQIARDIQTARGFLNVSQSSLS